MSGLSQAGAAWWLRKGGNSDWKCGWQRHCCLGKRSPPRHVSDSQAGIALPDLSVQGARFPLITQAVVAAKSIIPPRA